MIAAAIVAFASLGSGLPVEGAAAVPAVTVTPLRGGERIDAVLDGFLVGQALPRRAGGGHDVVVLVGPPLGESPGSKDGPCPDRTRKPRRLELWRLRLERDTEPDRAAWEKLQDDLPGDATALEPLDVDGDGDDELLLATPRELLVLVGPRFDPRSEPALTGAELDVRTDDVRSGSTLRVAPDRPWIAISRLGGTDFYRPGGQGVWQRFAEVPLAANARIGERSIEVWGVPLEPLEADARGRSSFLAPAQALGDRRLRVWLVRPEESEAASRRVECWARLPGAEHLLEQRFHLLRGEPVLVVTTQPAGKLSFFGEKQLRVFALAADRSRLGHAPLFAVETRANLWQTVESMILDVDHDGREDLVLGYWKGLKDDRVVLDVYHGNESGSFDTHPHSSAFDVADGDRAFLDYGSDVDGDGWADLLVIGDHALRLHRGIAVGKSADGPVESRPARVLELGDGFRSEDEVTLSVGSEGTRFSGPARDPGAPRCVDLDGDGLREVVFSHPEKEMRLRLRIVRFLSD